VAGKTEAAGLPLGKPGENRPRPDFRERAAAILEEVGLALGRLSEAGCRGIDLPAGRIDRIETWGRAPSGEGEALAEIRADIGDCRRCRLSEARRNIVFGDGNPEAWLVFVGEGPGGEEDLKGLPFVGAAGRLLTRIIEAIGMRREDVYICNVVKCRPPGNRNPAPDEVGTCFPFLERQLAAIRPRFVCALGNFAAQTLIGTGEPISRLRGRFHDVRGIRVLPTYHPAFLLRNPERKRDVWEDMKKLMAAAGLPIPPGRETQ